MQILAAKSESCDMCKGIVYKLKTTAGILYQCSSCGCCISRSDGYAQNKTKCDYK